MCRCASSVVLSFRFFEVTQSISLIQLFLLISSKLLRISPPPNFALKESSRGTYGIVRIHALVPHNSYPFIVTLISSSGMRTQNNSTPISSQCFALHPATNKLYCPTRWPDSNTYGEAHFRMMVIVPFPTEKLILIPNNYVENAHKRSPKPNTKLYEHFKSDLFWLLCNTSDT
jgi:hypothetical protein